jgi:hypothetical protein
LLPLEDWNPLPHTPSSNLDVGSNSSTDNNDAEDALGGTSDKDASSTCLARQLFVLPDAMYIVVPASMPVQEGLAFEVEFGGMMRTPGYVWQRMRVRYDGANGSFRDMVVDRWHNEAAQVE